MRKRKMERRNGKACGLFKKKMRDERERDWKWDWDWRWLSNGLLGFEFLLGFGILKKKRKKWVLQGLVWWVLLLLWFSASGIDKDTPKFLAMTHEPHLVGVNKYTFFFQSNSLTLIPLELAQALGQNPHQLNYIFNEDVNYTHYQLLFE